MMIVDVNLLIYAVNQDSPLHKKAKPWLEAAASRVPPFDDPIRIIPEAIKCGNRV
jgi:hypothetical protein